MQCIPGIVVGILAVGSAFGQAAPVGQSLLKSSGVDVTFYQAAPGQSLNLKSNHGDAIAIISDSISWTPATEIDSEGDAEPGEPLFLEQGSKRLFYPNAGERMAFSVYLIELKRHWAMLMGYCNNVKKCVRSIRDGKRTMGMAKLYFGNGEVSASRYQMAKGGVFAENFSTEKNPTDVVLVALAPLTTVANGEKLQIKAGEAHLFNKPQSIAFRAESDSAMWVTIRIPAQ